MLRSTQVAHYITTKDQSSFQRTQQMGKTGSNPCTAENSPTLKPKPLFGRLRSFPDMQENIRFQQTSGPLTIDPRNLACQQNPLSTGGLKNRDFPRSPSRSPEPQNLPTYSYSTVYGGMKPRPQSPVKQTATFFDLEPRNNLNFVGSNTLGSPRQAKEFNPLCPSPNLQARPLQSQNSASGNFNIFEYFHQQQALQNQQAKHNSPLRETPFNPPSVADPHQPPSYHNYSPQFLHQTKQQPSDLARGYTSSPQVAPLKTHFLDQFGSNSNPFECLRGPPQVFPVPQSFPKDFKAEDSNEHTKIREDTSTTHNSQADSGHSDPFHGKSMRSIQLYNLPTTANPNKLHPSLNPMVKAESPKRMAIKKPPKGRPSLLNIHSDSCFNFLNKRRYKVSPHELTPLEAFFLRESQNQFKVSSALQKVYPNLTPSNRPKPPKRTKKYMLILDIDETLVHSEPVITSGQPTANANKKYDKTLRFENDNGTHDVYGVNYRPFLKDFVKRMGKLFDLAVYTASARDYADAVMDTIDPKRTAFCARLYRENCLPVSGMNIKNLAIFEGPDVFIVDNLIYSYAFHMPQGIPICAFVDDPMDVELQDLAEILENLPYYKTLPALIDDLLGLDEFYQDLTRRLTHRP